MNFFFQAEDGIRDGHVTGVQTCALPIFCILHLWGFYKFSIYHKVHILCSLYLYRFHYFGMAVADIQHRSEERRVGKESRTGMEQSVQKKKARETERGMRIREK